MQNVPKVSVSIITYNHENYIAEAIDSVLKQETDFEYELIIGDDCSTDGTVKILKEYQSKHPHIIHLILHPERNNGIPGRLNNITNLYACRGHYVALLDGDDYWLDENKLQFQVDFMENNPSYAIIASDAVKITENGERAGGYYSDSHYDLKNNATFTHEQVLRAGWCITQTSTILYQNKLFKEFPDWYWNIISADFGLLLLLSQFGDIKYFEKPWTAYRIHDDSFMAKHYFSQQSLLQKVFELQTIRKTFLPYIPMSSTLKNLRVSYTLNRKIAWFKYRCSKHIKQNRGTVAALWYMCKSATSDFSGIFFLRIAAGKLGLWPRA